MRYIHIIVILDLTCQKSFQWLPGVSQFGKAIFLNVCLFLCINIFNCFSSRLAVECYSHEIWVFVVFASASSSLCIAPRDSQIYFLAKMADGYLWHLVMAIKPRDACGSLLPPSALTYECICSICLCIVGLIACRVFVPQLLSRHMSLNALS